MTLKEMVKSVKESEIAKLVFEGRTLGLRVKFFNVNILKFEYYDFELETISDARLIAFVKSIKNMSSLQLHRTGTGLLVTDAEIKHNINVQEFENEADVARVLTAFIPIYAAKEAE